MYKKINKTQARKRWKNKLPFVICPCNFHPTSPWNVSFHITANTVNTWEEKASNGGKDDAFDLFYSNWAFFNLDNDKDGLGDKATYYVET